MNEIICVRNCVYTIIYVYYICVYVSYLCTCILNLFELSPGSRQEVNLYVNMRSIFLPICPAMKIANFWLERDYLTVKVSSKGAFKDKNNGARIFKVW